MSTILGFVHAFHTPHERRSISGGVLSGLRLYWDAIRDGSAALSRYNELTARGVPHDAAVREIFGEHFSPR